MRHSVTKRRGTLYRGSACPGVRQKITRTIILMIMIMFGIVCITSSVYIICNDIDLLLPWSSIVIGALSIMYVFTDFIIGIFLPSRKAPRVSRVRQFRHYR